MDPDQDNDDLEPNNIRLTLTLAGLPETQPQNTTFVFTGEGEGEPVTVTRLTNVNAAVVFRDPDMPLLVPHDVWPGPEFQHLVANENEDEPMNFTDDDARRAAVTEDTEEDANDFFAPEGMVVRDFTSEGEFVKNYLKQRKEDNIAAVWLKSTPEDVATKLIVQDYFRRLVPKIYAPKQQLNCLQLFFDETLANEVLIEPLERYIFNDEDPQQYFEKLEGINPASLCGRVFKPGEPTYSCRDCGLDPTCVLCVDCFQNSAHQQHRYKISTSSGGGYCDCGDNEAWKNDFYCDSHNPELAATCAKSLEKVQSGLKERIDLVLSVVIGYCHNRFIDGNLVQLSPNHLSLTELEIEELDAKDNADLYCTALYNDEIHTFEMVIQTLQKAVSCTKKEAIEYATMIDREGRSLVYISDFTDCAKVKQISERQTSRTGQQPLKIEVLQSFVIAHQIFALKLMSWIKKIVSYAAEIREMFYDIMTRTIDMSRPLMRQDEIARFGDTVSYLSSILQSDTHLWKAQRSAWHNLIIAGILRDYEMKKKFAVEFSKRYPDLFKDFITDDHDHAISITSLSVQIYTVPTIAHYLIAEHNVLFTIMRTFLSEFESKLNDESKLQLLRTSNAAFKRAQYAILDLKYLLTNPPNEWNEQFRKSFIQGVCHVIKLLSWMQEWDPIVRQTGAHMEYEPEWETAFNFHIKLAPVTSLIQQWCSTDAEVCTRTYRHVLSSIRQVYGGNIIKTCCRELVNHSATCYCYDVSTEEVSIHLPLTRFAAGLHVRFDQFGLSFNSPQFNMDEKPTPLMLMEPSLRMVVLVVQVHCGLWKRNGFALLNQLYFYHNVKCRSDMLDKDILSLQIGASLIESNEYLLHVLNRFGLMGWAENNYDDKPLKLDDDGPRVVIALAEQFFTLINTIVSARYVPGVALVTYKECIQNEIIQFLCKDSLTHSQLNKVLVENVNCETGLEQHIHEIATFKKNSNVKAGAGFTYELRPEFYDKYDVFHYHFTHEEMSTAEERQRIRKKALREPEFFPPPKLPLFNEQFSLIPNLLKSDILLNLMALVLKRSMKQSSRSFSDSQLRMVLHLICQGLNEEGARNELERDHFFQFTTAAKKWEIFSLLEKLLKETSLSHHHDLILWIFRNYHLLKPTEDLGALEDLVQMSKAEEEKEKKKKLAASIRERRLAEINAAQKNFYTVNADLFLEDEASADLLVSDIEMLSENSVALGMHQSKRNTALEKCMCILCHKEQLMCEATSTFVLCAFIQRSTVMSQNRSALQEAERKLSGKDHLEARNPLFLNPDLLFAPHVATCGHAMHSVCWKKHYEGVLTKERRRPYRHPSSFDFDNGEYLCPMCGCLSNTILMVTKPCVLSKETVFSQTQQYELMNDFGAWIKMWSNLVKTKVTKPYHHKISIDVVTLENDKSRIEDFSVWEVGPKVKHRGRLANLPDIEKYYFSGNISLQPRISPPLNSDEIPKSFLTSLYNIALDAAAGDGIDYRLPMMVWQAVSYTITSFEANHRELNLPFFGNSVPTRQASSMCYLARCGTILTEHAELQIHDNYNTVHSLGLKLMDALVRTGKTNRFPCVVEFDAFTMLVSLTYATPYIFTNKESKSGEMGGSDVVCLKDLFLLRLVTIVHMAQIVISNNLTDKLCPENETLEERLDAQVWEAGVFARVCKEVWSFTGVIVPPTLNWEGVWNSVCEAAVPFLRCAAKFYESLTGILPGKCLEGVETSFEDLVHYLGLPMKSEDYFSDFEDFNCTKFVLNPRLADIFLTNKLYQQRKLTIENSGYPILMYNPKVLLVTYPRRIGNLAKLPDDYAELINSVSLFTCQNCDENDSKTPTMCLICGRILCSQSYCCQYSLGNSQVGACTYHTYYCGGGVGIFLRIRECKVFYLCGKNKGSFIFPPYLDVYGETDQGLRRGNAMTLSMEKYNNYRRSWMLHTIPEEIARITEHSTTITIAEWQYL